MALSCRGGPRHPSVGAILVIARERRDGMTRARPWFAITDAAYKTGHYTAIGSGRVGQACE